jgi:HEPN domain-containing protein
MIEMERRRHQAEMDMERQKLALEREKHAHTVRESQGAAQAEAHAQLAPMLEQLARMHSAPVEIIRDPKTGKAMGARRVVN